MGCVPSLFQFGSYAVEEAPDSTEKPERTPPPPCSFISTEEKKPAPWSSSTDSQVKAADVPSRVKEKTPPVKEIQQEKGPEVAHQEIPPCPEVPPPPPKEEEKPESPQEDLDYGGTDVQEAVVKIQAGIRGYLTRKALKEDGSTQHGSVEPVTPASVKDTSSFQETDTAAEPPVSSELDQGSEEKAAVKIQSLYRGYRTRKQLDDLKDYDADEDPTSETLIAEAPPDLFEVEDDVEALESAATKLQATFRGYQVRKQLQDSKEATPELEEQSTKTIEVDTRPEDEEDKELEMAAKKVQATFRGFQVRKQLKDSKEATPELETETVEVDTRPDEDDEDLKLAATKVQATFRGFQVRKQLKDSKEATPELEDQDTETKDEEDDTEAMAMAATKLQATFRGHQTRKQLKESKETTPELNDTQPSDDAPSADVELELTEDEARAATKIQSVYRGYKVRKDMKKPGDPEEEGDASEEGLKGHSSEPTFPSAEDEEEEEEEEEEEDEELNDVIHHPSPPGDKRVSGAAGSEEGQQGSPSHTK